jgi:O-antigen/teichoic acid export membrane protein
VKPAPPEQPLPSASSSLDRRNVTYLFGANTASLIVIGLSYAAYSRLFSAEQFAVYSAALAIAALASIILDGGLRTAVIKAPQKLDDDTVDALTCLMVIASLALTLLVGSFQAVIGLYWEVVRKAHLFVVAYVALHLLSYALTAIPTALLERRLDYRTIAWLEAGGSLLERASPALILWITDQGMYAFLWGLLISRIYHVAFLWWFGHLRPLTLKRPPLTGLRQLLTEGAWIQGVTGTAIVRDNLHLILVGPLFGRDWAGYYGWALQLCVLTSQAFVQIAARVSVPLFARKQPVSRWSSCLDHIRTLAVFVGPVLVGTLVAAPGIDRYLSGGKWAPAIALLPLLFARMLPGIATTPLGTLLLVEKGGRSLAGATALWTGLEVVSAVCALVWLGPTGLAWSYATVVWLGLGIFIVLAVRGLPERRVMNVLGTLSIRSGLAVAATMAAVMTLAADRLDLATPQVRIIIGLMVVGVGYTTDVRVRQTLAGAVMIPMRAAQEDR